MGRIGRYVSVSNVLSVIALFAALGTGAAVALPGKGTVDENDIAKNAVGSRALAPSALSCPSEMQRVGGLCYDKQPYVGANQLSARYTCAEQGKQLPSRAELLRVAFTGKFPTGGGELWTDSADSAGNAGTIEKIAADNIPSRNRDAASTFAFHCVKEATP